ncbi:MAG: PH domain-containing protein [Candidatus Berkelbacteria bacterium]|nr:PH domain-containing protein [Candidatus Berkelbacteria bacterium]
MNKRVAEESDEEIIEEVRQHPIMLAGPMFKVFVGFVIVVFIFLIFNASFVFSLAFFAWVIFGGIYTFYHYFIWRKDKYILTNSRIIIKEQKTFFSKQVSEAKLEDITDVTYKVKGFWATIFNYGTVRAETASSDPLKLKNVAHPHKIQNLMLDLRDRYLEATNKEMTARELLNHLEETKDIKKDNESGV